MQAARKAWGCGRGELAVRQQGRGVRKAGAQDPIVHTAIILSIHLPLLKTLWQLPGTGGVKTYRLCSQEVAQPTHSIPHPDSSSSFNKNGFSVIPSSGLVACRFESQYLRDRCWGNENGLFSAIRRRWWAPALKTTSAPRCGQGFLLGGRGSTTRVHVSQYSALW